MDETNTRPTGGGGSSALAGARNAMAANNADVNVLVFGDSTGDSTIEWVYASAEWLSTLYPTHSVSYRLFNSGTDTYNAATAISAGSGANTLRFWNASVSGANLYSLRGSKLDPIAVTPFGGGHPDLVIISLGENATPFNSITPAQRGQMIAMIEEVLLLHPGVPIAIVLQNPLQFDNTMDQVIASWRDVKALRPELTLIDVHSLFLAANKDASLYIDSVHPSAAGTLLYVQAIKAAWNQSTAAPSSGSFIAWLTNRAAYDVLYNGDFAAFSGAAPDNFSFVGTGGLLTKDVSVKAPGKAYSAKMVNGTASANLRQILDATQLAAVKGRKVTLAVHHYIDSAPVDTDVNSGRTRVFTNGTGSTGAIHSAGNAGQAGWRWDIISGVDIPSDATLLWAMDYANSAAGTTKGTVYVDEIRLFIGEKCGG